MASPTEPGRRAAPDDPRRPRRRAALAAARRTSPAGSSTAVRSTAASIAERYGPRIDGDAPDPDVGGRGRTAGSVGFLQDYRIRDHPEFAVLTPDPDAIGVDYADRRGGLARSRHRRRACCAAGSTVARSGLSRRDDATSPRPTTATSHRAGCCSRVGFTEGIWFDEPQPDGSVATLVGHSLDVRIGAWIAPMTDNAELVAVPPDPGRARRPRVDRHRQRARVRRQARRRARRPCTRWATRCPTFRSGSSPRASPGGRRSLLLVLQGMDTSGKGGTLRSTVGLMDPQGVRITSFKAPTPEELEHDFLWRIRKALPETGLRRRLRPVALRGRAHRPGARSWRRRRRSSGATTRSTPSRPSWSRAAPRS